MSIRHPIAGSPDHRFDAARATNQAQGRGWDFSPARPRRYPVNLIKAVLVLGVSCLIFAALWSL